MSEEKLIKKFNMWFQKEGQFMIHPTIDLKEIKKVLLTAWLNGAYTLKEIR